MENKPAPTPITIEKNYDSDFCGSIPLHLVNLIQPHGVLLVLDKEELRVKQASENVAQWLSLPVDELLEQLLSHYLSARQYEDLLQKINSPRTREKIPLTLTFTIQGKSTDFTALVHPGQEFVLVELEESQPSAQDKFSGIYQQITYITSLLKAAATTAEVAQVAAAELKNFTGFDRVLVYQFDPQWNGSVIGQAKEEDMDDYMHLRFPASDVPKQARELYFKNPYRLIPNQDYTPVRLLPIINPLTQRFTDLSECNLRSVAGVHLEYLANMKITASMSLPLIIDNRLWGLISCHHKTAKYPSYEMRSSMELLSGILSAQIAAKENEKNMLLRVSLRSIHAQLTEQLYTTNNMAEGLLEGPASILDLLALSGAALVYEGNISTSGTTPGNQELKELISWLRRNKAQKLFATDQLPLEYPHSKSYKDVASGLIALPINAEQGDFILGFRPEVVQTVSWGGDPNNAIQMEPNGKNYHPRNSFAIYKETVKHTSMRWQEEELLAAEALRNAVLEKIIREH